MAQVSMQQVKELRDRTQAGLNDCRAALSEAEGDMDKAVEVILKKGLAKSAKRAGALATEGVVAARVAADGTSGVIAEVNIQTDFAARNPDFLELVERVLDVAEKTEEGADLGAQPHPSGSGTLEDARAALVGRLGENITIRRWAKISVPGGRVQSYVHMGGKIGVLLGVSVGDAAALARPELTELVENVSMQAAAMQPLFLSTSEVDAASKAKQSEIYESQLRDEGKPEKSWPKIIEGKLSKWMKEVCLVEQDSVIDSKKTVDDLRKDTAKAVGTDVTFVRFARFERGEGIEKPSEPDFADEVARMAGQA